MGDNYFFDSQSDEEYPEKSIEITGAEEDIEYDSDGIPIHKKLKLSHSLKSLITPK